MTPKVKKMYKEARNNPLFESDIKKNEPNFNLNDLLWSNNQKVLYSSIYFGWLIARGEYVESNY
jgi:hypothetical protein